MEETATITAGSAPAGVDEAFVRRAVDMADVNALRLALYQQTGDPELTAIAVLRHTREGSPFEALAIAPEDQQIVKDKAVAFLMRAGRAAPVMPTRPQAAELMQLFSGEAMSQSHIDYGWEDLAFEGFPRAAEWDVKPPQAVLDQSKVTIIGAGFSGLLAGIQFARLGLEFRIIERQAGVGGTWFLNDYPEARVDIPSFLYQFKFEKDYPWRSYYATQGELREYLDHILDKYDLRRHIQLETSVEAAHWEEARKLWVLETRTADGRSETIESRFVVSASGLFSTPKLPDIVGIERFAGKMFHTTAWDHAYDYTGKRVAVIGTGSTGSQLARGVAEKVASMTIYQRSPKWLSRVANYRHAIPAEERWLFDTMPAYVNWYCYGLHLAAMQMDAFHDVDRDWQAKGGVINEKNDTLRANFQRYIRRKVGDDDALYEQLVPTCAPLSRRLVIDNDWYDTILRDNVELVSGKIDHITETGVVSGDGTERTFDLIVLAAGFDVERYLWPVDYVGRDGATPAKLWERDGARAHLTLTLPGLPNFIIMYGPNAGILSGSFHSWIEIYTRYFCKLITNTIEAGAAAFDVKPEVYRDYNEKLDRKMTQKIWLEEIDAGGYYINSHGRPGVSMPWSLAEFYEMIRTPEMDEYVLS